MHGARIRYHVGKRKALIDCNLRSGTRCRRDCKQLLDGRRQQRGSPTSSAIAREEARRVTLTLELPALIPTSSPTYIHIHKMPSVRAAAHPMYTACNNLVALQGNTLVRQ